MNNEVEIAEEAEFTEAPKQGKMLDMLDTTRIKELSKDEDFVKVTGILSAFLQLPINQGMKPVLWGELIEAINTCIDKDKFIEHDGVTSAFGVVVQLSPEDNDRVMYMVKCMMAFEKDESGTVVKRGQILIDTTVQSVGRTTMSELTSFRDKELLAKYKHRGEKVLSDLYISALELREMDTLYKHCLLALDEYKVRVDGAEIHPPFYLLDKNGQPVITLKRFDSTKSAFAMTVQANLRAVSGDALLTTDIVAGCTTSTNDEALEIQHLHTTVNIRHILSANDVPSTEPVN